MFNLHQQEHCVDIEAVWSRFGDPLRHFIAARVSDADMVDELTQQLLIKSYQKLDTLKEHERVEGWLYRIARNLVHDHYRQQQKESVDPSIAVEALIDSSEEKSAAEVIREELGHCIRPMIDQLPAQYRRTLTAVALEGKSQKRLADELGVSHSTVRSQTQRGRAQLQQRLKRCCDFRQDARGVVMEYQPKPGQCNTDCLCSERL